MSSTFDQPPAGTRLPQYAYRDLPRLMTLMTGDERHSSSATSTLDVLWVLYDRILRVDANRPMAEERDRFVLSKGHGPIAFYAALAAKGFIPEETLPAFGRYDSPLGYHPDRNLITGVEFSSGSLGHGLPVAVGMALGLRAKGNVESRVFCLVGDAELDEGTNQEAIVAASRLGLERLTVVLVDNQSSSLRWPEEVATRFTVEGWWAQTVDGRDHDALEQALNARDAGRPGVVVAVVEDKYAG